MWRCLLTKSWKVKGKVGCEAEINKWLPRRRPAYSIANGRPLAVFGELGLQALNLGAKQAIFVVR